MLIDDKQILDSIYKKAVGYSVDEEVIEYSSEGDVLKRKVSTKYIPPDLSALKIYMEINESNKNLCAMTDEELLAEKQRLLNQLHEFNEKKSLMSADKNVNDDTG